MKISGNMFHLSSEWRPRTLIALYDQLKRSKIFRKRTRFLVRQPDRSLETFRRLKCVGGAFWRFQRSHRDKESPELRRAEPAFHISMAHVDITVRSNKMHRPNGEDENVIPGTWAVWSAVTNFRSCRNKKRFQLFYSRNKTLKDPLLQCLRDFC